MAIKDAPVVDIIEFDENEAYNPDRPISSLIRTQLLHLHQAEHIVVPQKRVQISTSIHCSRSAKPVVHPKSDEVAAQIWEGHKRIDKDEKSCRQSKKWQDRDQKKSGRQIQKEQTCRKKA